jgi:hypothetical protein
MTGKGEGEKGEKKERKRKKCSNSVDKGVKMWYIQTVQ